MKTKFSSKNERSARIQPPRTTGAPRQAAITLNASPDGSATRGYSIYLNQSASASLSIKLITERAGAAIQAPKKDHDRRNDGYSHWGLND